MVYIILSLYYTGGHAYIHILMHMEVEGQSSKNLTVSLLLSIACADFINLKNQLSL